MFAVLLLSFAAQIHARQLQQATCPSVIAQGIAAHTKSPVFTAGVATNCPASKFATTAVAVAVAAVDSEHCTMLPVACHFQKRC